MELTIAHMIGLFLGASISCTLLRFWDNRKKNLDKQFSSPLTPLLAELMETEVSNHETKKQKTDAGENYNLHIYRFDSQQCEVLWTGHKLRSMSQYGFTKGKIQYPITDLEEAELGAFVKTKIVRESMQKEFE